MERTQKRAWAEVDLTALKRNYLAIKETLPTGCKFVGVVKADAYGHGAVAVAHALEEAGCDYLAVACLEEGAQLRREGISMPILVLGITPPEWTGELLENKLTQTVSSPEDGRAYAKAAQEVGGTLTVHVAVETGMSRLGMNWQTAAQKVADLVKLPGLKVEGLYTHFSAADGDEAFTMEQLTRFLTVTDELARRGLRPGICHCASSAAVLHYPCTHMDMVRPGLALYGHYPEEGLEDFCELGPVMSLKTRVAAVQTLPQGATVSYGRTHTLQGDSRVAVLSMGYADGLNRRLSNRGEVLIRGERCPILGRICMDMAMVDVTHLPRVEPGDEVTVFGPGLPLEEVARLADTVVYDLLCGITKRVPRVYR